MTHKPEPLTVLALCAVFFLALAAFDTLRPRYEFVVVKVPQSAAVPFEILYKINVHTGESVPIEAGTTEEAYRCIEIIRQTHDWSRLGPGPTDRLK